MDYDKLINSIKLCGSIPKVDQCKQCAYWAGGDMSKCIPKMTADVATSLSTLQAENKKLRDELERAHEALDFARTTDTEAVQRGKGRRRERPAAPVAHGLQPGVPD